MQIPTEISDVIAYFMSEYAHDSPPSLLEEVIHLVLARNLNDERAEELTDKFLDYIQNSLVEEFNERYGSNKSLRYKLIDNEGSKIAGIGDLAKIEHIEFQNAISSISHSQFEGVSALVLRKAGCNFLRRTPDSHDQGLDAFGYMDILQQFSVSTNNHACKVNFLAQAKHYSQTKVGSKDIREFVGAATLALHKIYSSVDTKYQELDILPFSPTSLVFVTSEEVPGTVRRLAQRTGIIVLSSDDLFDMFVAKLANKPIKVTADWLKGIWLEEIEKIPVAR